VTVADGGGVILPPGHRVVGVGTDLVDIDRFRQVLARTPTIVDRIFTPGEQESVSSRRDPAPGLAARFAAKEAVLKSLGIGIFDLPTRLIEVVTDADSGAPSIALHERAVDLATERGVAGFLVSLTHTDHLAHALVTAHA